MITKYVSYSVSMGDCASGDYWELSTGWKVVTLPEGGGRAIDVEILARSVFGIRT